MKLISFAAMGLATAVVVLLLTTYVVDVISDEE
jgi:hypothetical protein